MMEKIGWKEGQGLGKQEQVIKTPLIAKKTNRRAGVIVNASEKKVKSVDFNGTPPTRVLLLRAAGAIGRDAEVEGREEAAGEIDNNFIDKEYL
ncbi:hypothetical protein D5086_012514 [Populus alba]|uniref:Uncharacterized protein n=1 Tax=Populus alba TaxID=43335 RepID=A0ACC4C471_POPAL